MAMEVSEGLKIRGPPPARTSTEPQHERPHPTPGMDSRSGSGMTEIGKWDGRVAGREY